MAERVLVVEDEPDVLDALVQLLAHAGYEARGEADGLAGLRAFQAALGAEITITALDKRQIKIKIPAGIQNGKLLRVKDEGVPVSGGRKGDLYLKIMVRIPTKLSARAKTLLSEVAKLEGENTFPEPIPLEELQ